jgi:hypothetical protein
MFAIEKRGQISLCTPMHLFALLQAIECARFWPKKRNGSGETGETGKLTNTLVFWEMSHGWQKRSD